MFFFGFFSQFSAKIDFFKAIPSYFAKISYLYFKFHSVKFQDVCRVQKSSKYYWRALNMNIFMNKKSSQHLVNRSL